MAKADYYEILGINKDASEAEIKSAFRKAAKQYHPDLHPGDAEAEKKFKEINEAYEVLSDPQKKAQYDQFGHAAFDPTQAQGGGFNGAGFGGFEDIFSAFTGGGFGGFGGDGVDLGDIFGDIFGGGFGGGFGGMGGGSSHGGGGGRGR